MNNTGLEKRISGTDFSSFMRQLHLLALLQNGSSDKTNYKTMTDLLSQLPWDGAVDDKKISGFVSRLKEMGFPVLAGKGERAVQLGRELTDDEMLEILPYYLNVVSDSTGIKGCFKCYVENHGSRSLSIIAQIYFASLRKKKIQLTYRSLKNSGPGKYILKPYRWVYRDNAVYLIAKNNRRDIELFRLNRIKGVTVMKESFTDEIPPAEELMKYSMGASIGRKRYNVKIRFLSDLREKIEEGFGHLELTFGAEGEDGYMDASFTVCDLLSVYQAVFGYSGGVKITEPKEAVDGMKRLLKWNMDIY